MIAGIGSLQHGPGSARPEGGNNPMMMGEADALFLKRILMILVAATVATGAMAGITTVKAELASRAAITLSN